MCPVPFAILPEAWPTVQLALFARIFQRSPFSRQVRVGPGRGAGSLKAAEEEMVRLVITFAKRVLKTEPLVRPEIILQHIDAALNKIAEVDKIVICINLKDKTMTEAHKQEFLRRLHTVADVKVVEDSSLAPGGGKIETGVGTNDASLETQAPELENQILKCLERPEEPAMSFFGAKSASEHPPGDLRPAPRPRRLQRRPHRHPEPRLRAALPRDEAVRRQGAAPPQARRPARRPLKPGVLPPASAVIW